MKLSIVVTHILTGAAKDALDFNERDPQSITTLADCVQANFEKWERTSAAKATGSDYTRKQLEILGFKF